MPKAGAPGPFLDFPYGLQVLGCLQGDSQERKTEAFKASVI
jgi:hypothetical protein